MVRSVLAALAALLLVAPAGAGSTTAPSRIAFGRDLGDMVAARHGTRSSRRAWLKATRGEQHFIGTLVSILFLVPFANLVAPVVGTAAAVHLFNRSYQFREGARERAR